MRKLTKKKGVDVVFEHVGADTFATSMLCLKRGGSTAYKAVASGYGLKPDRSALRRTM